MRTLLVALALLSADAGPPASSGRPATYAEARRAFARAYQAGALDEARSALGRATRCGTGTDGPRLRPRVPRGPGRAHRPGVRGAAGGQRCRALQRLGGRSRPGRRCTPTRDGRRSWRASRPRAPRSASEAGSSTVPSELGLVEDLAQDPATGAVFVSSVRTGEVWRERDGRWSAWAHPAPVGSGAFALGLDPRRQHAARGGGRGSAGRGLPEGRPGPVLAGDVRARRWGRGPAAGPARRRTSPPGRPGARARRDGVRLGRARRHGVPAAPGGERPRGSGPGSHLRQPADAGAHRGRRNAARSGLDARPLRAAARRRRAPAAASDRAIWSPPASTVSRRLRAAWWRCRTASCSRG